MTPTSTRASPTFLVQPFPNLDIFAASCTESIAAIAATVNTIKNKLPFGVTLPQDERQALLKLEIRGEL